MVAGLIELLKGAKLTDFKIRPTSNFETLYIVFMLKHFQSNIVSNTFDLHLSIFKVPQFLDKILVDKILDLTQGLHVVIGQDIFPQDVMIMNYNRDMYADPKNTGKSL